MRRFHCACLGRVTQDAWPLLREAARLRHFDLDTSGAENSHKALAQASLSQAHASHARRLPPSADAGPAMQTLSHERARETKGKHSFRSEKEFKREARRITRWYRKAKEADSSSPTAGPSRRPEARDQEARSGAYHKDLRPLPASQTVADRVFLQLAQYGIDHHTVADHRNSMVKGEWEAQNLCYIKPCDLHDCGQRTVPLSQHADGDLQF